VRVSSFEFGLQVASANASGAPAPGFLQPEIMSLRPCCLPPAQAALCSHSAAALNSGCGVLSSQGGYWCCYRGSLTRRQAAPGSLAAPEARVLSIRVPEFTIT
jgi:hypothetical protein